jgi:hypothetical protein
MSSVADGPQTMTMFEWQAWATENAADSLAFWIEKTREDKVGWAPSVRGSVETRNALQLGAECVSVNRMMASMFRGDPPLQENHVYEKRAACADAVRASGKELGDAIRKLGPESVEKLYTTPYGPMPGKMLLQIALGNMQYHGGQINLIQLLYGDPKFYIPGRD